MLPGRDSNPRQGGYSVSLCFPQGLDYLIALDFTFGRRALTGLIDRASHPLVSARFWLPLRFTRLRSGLPFTRVSRASLNSPDFSIRLSAESCN